MDDAIAMRRSSLQGLTLPAAAGRFSLSDAGPSARFIYRGDPAVPAGAFGVVLPQTPMRAAMTSDRAALWLGPDEWLLLAPYQQGSLLRQTLAQVLQGKPASLVDISHRQAGLIVDGPAAAELLTAGCPLDLDESAFPPGMCTRTLFAKAEIVLWRTAPATFRIEVGRSFAPYVVGVLDVAARGLRPQH